MAGGTEFRFATEGIHRRFGAARALQRAAATSASVAGVSTIRQYLRAALIDELHLAIRPVITRFREHLLNGTRYGAPWAMNARSTSRANVRPTSFCASARDASRLARWAALTHLLGGVNSEYS